MTPERLSGVPHEARGVADLTNHRSVGRFVASDADRSHRPIALPVDRGSGGDEGTRTPDPRDANAVLFQLSYIPTGDGL
jgi:hypothetical protein